MLLRTRPNNTNLDAQNRAIRLGGYIYTGSKKVFSSLLPSYCLLSFGISVPLVVRCDRRVDPPTVRTPQLYSPTRLALKLIERSLKAPVRSSELDFPDNENSPLKSYVNMKKVRRIGGGGGGILKQQLLLWTTQMGLLVAVSNCRYCLPNSHAVPASCRA